MQLILKQYSTTNLVLIDYQVNILFKLEVINVFKPEVLGKLDLHNIVHRF